MQKVTAISNDQLLELGQDVGKLIAENFQAIKSVRSKKNHSYVTDTDIAVDQAIEAKLHAWGFNQENILSEESSVNRNLEEDDLWIIDPLDGTREFVYQIPEVSVSIHYRRAGQFSASIVINPVNHFYIVATSKERPQFNKPDLKKLYTDKILVSRSEEKKGLIDKLQAVEQVASVGSVAYKLGLVAAGYAKAIVSYRPKNVWDVAAGFHLVEQSGGKITDLEGNAFVLSDYYREKLRGGILATAKGYDHEKVLRVTQDSIVSRNSLC